MAERKTESAEHLVDEMKRKARRRLVGAVVLALGAIIVLPLLLEKEPRPLGDDVSVQIPPVDEGKFINRLTGKAAEKALPKAESKATTATPAAPEPKPEPRGDATSAPSPPTPTPTPKGEPAAPSAAPKAEPAVNAAAPADAGTDAKSAQVASAPAETPAAAPSAAAPSAAAPSAAAPSAAAPSAAAPSAAAPSAAAAKAEGFVVQLAAFADDKGANALANKLKKNGYAAYVQSVETSRGTLWRVRVGGYATRPEADAARVKLKGEGYNGIIAPAQ